MSLRVVLGIEPGPRCCKVGVYLGDSVQWSPEENLHGA